MFLEQDLSVDEDALLEALTHGRDRRILAAAQERGLTAQEIRERTEIPNSTLYRRINELHQEGLLEVVDAVIDDGHRIERYRCRLSSVGLQVEDGSVEVDWELRSESP